MNNLQRFSSRVDNYVKYRPSYPGEIVDFLEKEKVLTPGSIIADIGSGTGISSRLFLDRGYTVFGVEPNDAMRNAAEETLNSFASFYSVNGTAENTGLKSHSIDLIVCAQAFHWFEPEATSEEFKRILNKNGKVALIWNERITSGDQFHEEYEKILNNWGLDYKRINHKNFDEVKIGRFLSGGYRKKIYYNDQVLDLEGLKGRLLSSSYVPEQGHPDFQPMMEDIEKLFNRFNIGQMVAVKYETKVFLGTVKNGHT